ncbi:DUF6064 family protein [Devosia nitrariae]|uniref:AmiS/UreI family transporter n=1 Tax=Devosia nitrariae TaxID=2071872 RepID=A0ABQ5W9Z6_9HYPH|nr:DUF6064 family protein [Devosia nitrariae]GLQ56659.1 hypothetical protein GCM10010862_39180 [Devosia nitrariae]
MLPFSREGFIGVFVDYNLAVWPLQIVAYVVGVGMVALLFRSSSLSGRLIAAGLAAMWLWTGVVYHGIYFSTINAAAVLFGILFALQGAAFLYFGVVRGHLQFAPPSRPIGWIGTALVGYAAILYPMIGIWVGHEYAEMPMFGITPCPVTIFTFGLLLLTTDRFSRWLLVIPFLWTLVGGSAAFLLGIPQDWLLLFTGVVAGSLLMWRDGRAGKAATA